MSDVAVAGLVCGAKSQERYKITIRPLQEWPIALRSCSMTRGMQYRSISSADQVVVLEIGLTKDRRVRDAEDAKILKPVRQRPCLHALSLVD